MGEVQSRQPLSADSDVALVAEAAIASGQITDAATLRVNIDKIYEKHRGATRLYKVNCGGVYGFVAATGTPSVSSDGQLALIDGHPQVVLYHAGNNELVIGTQGKTRIYKNVVRAPAPGVPVRAPTVCVGDCGAGVGMDAGARYMTAPYQTTAVRGSGGYAAGAAALQAPVAANCGVKWNPLPTCTVGASAQLKSGDAPLVCRIPAAIPGPPPVPGPQPPAPVPPVPGPQPGPQPPAPVPPQPAPMPFVVPICVPKGGCIDPRTICPFNTAQDQQTAQVCAQKPAECAEALTELRCKLRERLRKYYHRH